MAVENGIIVKAYLDSQEIRRFLLETAVSTSFEYLKQKTHQIFQIPQGEFLRFSWKDADNEFITISSDEELLEAVNQLKENMFRLYLSRKTSNSPGGDTDGGHSDVLHSNVVCDGCQGEVRGTRYKCAVCPDYDLCARCEFEGKHPEHNMMCVRRPVVPCDWRFWRDFASSMGAQAPPPQYPHPQAAGPTPPPQYPHPQAGATPPPFMAGQRPLFGFGGPWAWGGYPWQCRKQWKKAWKCHQKMQRENSRKRDGGAACGASAGPETATPGPSPAAPEAAPAAGAESPEAERPRWGEAQKEFLVSMGEAVQSMLNPFGIDVTFSLDHQSAQAKPDEEKEKPAAEVVDVDAEGKKEEATPPPAPKSPHGMNVDLDSSPSSPDAQRTAEFIVIDPDDVEEARVPPAQAQKIAHSVELMKRMGFKDDDGWLTQMLTRNDGNIDKVLDLIQAKCKA